MSCLEYGKVKLLYKCQLCGTILSLEFEDQEELIKAREDLFEVICVCQEEMKPLRD